MDLFNKCLAVILKNEGGYSNHPNDPGKATNYGVTQMVYDNYRKINGEPTQDVRDISDEEVYDIYLTAYWIPMNLTGIVNEELILQIFDMGVNAGIRTAIKLIQRIVDVKDDGIIGKKTTAAINSFPEDLVSFYKHERDVYYHVIVEKNPKLAVFLNGWLNRIKNTHF
jgi:lysozyme family protein